MLTYLSNGVGEAVQVPTERDRRIAAVDLIKGAHVIPELSEDTARLFGYLFCGVWWVATTFILTLSWHWLAFITLIPLGVSLTWFVASSTASVPVIAQTVHKYWTIPRNEPLTSDCHTKEWTEPAAYIKAGNWVYLRNEYKPGRSGDPPPYRLLVATFPLSGSEQAVAFSDGTGLIWNQRSKVLVADCPQIATLRERAANDAMRNAAVMLGKIFELLDRNDSGQSIESMTAHLGDNCELDIFRALVVASSWSLIKLSGKGRLRRNARSYGKLIAQLTEAGQYWHQAPSGFKPGHDTGRKNVPKGPGRQQSIRIENPSGSTIIVAGGNISKPYTSTAQNVQISDSQLLLCLREILDLQEIPWSDSELVDVRRVIQEALTERNPRKPELKRKLVKLQSVCGEVLVGMLSSGAYQLLLHFLT